VRTIRHSTRSISSDQFSTGGTLEWRGWHAARRGLGSKLYRLGVPDIVIQRILRHANVSAAATHYIKTTTVDVRNAMKTLETHIPSTPETLTDTYGTLKPDAEKLFASVN